MKLDTPATKPEQCAVLIQAEVVLERATSLRSAVNKLRRDLRRCDDCANREECLPLREFNSQINTALEDLAVEWGRV